jgi:Fic/DOC family
LIELHRVHTTNEVQAEIEAAWLHHRFTQIHPFTDGNGRVARAIATLVLIKAGWFPLTIKSEHRSGYFDALEAADVGNIRPFVGIVVEGQRDALFQAMEVSYDLKPSTSPHDAVLAVRDHLRQRGKLPHKEWLVAKSTAQELIRASQQRLGQISADLSQQLSGAIGTFVFNVLSSSGFDESIRSAALKRVGQVASIAEYSHVIRLILTPETMIEISFHALGPRYHGIIAVVAYLSVSGTPTPLGDTFQINYEEPEEAALTRFTPWLDRIVTQGLMEWRRTL